MKIHELVEGVEYVRLDGQWTYRMSCGTLESRYRDGEWNIAKGPYDYFMNMKFTECEFEPKDGERYYYPSFRYLRGYECSKWYKDSTHEHTKDNVGVYRTKEQAIEKARELGWME